MGREYGPRRFPPNILRCNAALSLSLSAAALSPRSCVNRSNHEASLKELLQRCRFIAHLISQNTEPAPPGTDFNSPPGGSGAPELVIRNTSTTGHMLRFCNAIRLQAALLSPSAFLRQFLQSHATWRQVLPDLLAVTARQSEKRMGFAIRQDEGENHFELSSPLDARSSIEDITIEAFGDVEAMSPEAIGHGSEFARVMGFDGEVEWSGSPTRRKKNKKKKKRKIRGGSRTQKSPGSPDRAASRDALSSPRLALSPDTPGGSSSCDEDVDDEDDDGDVQEEQDEDLDEAN